MNLINFCWTEKKPKENKKKKVKTKIKKARPGQARLHLCCPHFIYFLYKKVTNDMLCVIIEIIIVFRFDSI